MKPSQVYGLWINIHALHEELIRSQFIKGDLLNKYRAIEPQSFEDITPQNVYLRAIEVHANLRTYFDLPKTPLMPSWVEEFRKIEGNSETSVVRPSQVYLLSATILNQLVEKLIDVTYAQHSIGEFYTTHNAENKTPNDVFSMVDLLDKRIKLINQATLGQ